VEVTEGKQENSSDADVKNGSAHNICSLIGQPLIAGDATG